MYNTTWAVVLCGPISFLTPAWGDSMQAPHNPNSIDPVSYAASPNRCPNGLHPVLGADGVSCGGKAQFSYITVSSLDEVPEGYTGRIYVLNPRTSGYQDLGW